jgi:hypothetical protein
MLHDVLFFLGYLTCCQNAEHIALDSAVTDELEMIWKEAVMA